MCSSIEVRGDADLVLRAAGFSAILPSRFDAMLRYCLCTVGLLAGLCHGAEPNGPGRAVGTWIRAAIRADDGATKVTPRLVISSDKQGSDLIIGTSSDRPGFAEDLSLTVYRIVSSEQNVLVVDVDGKRVKVEYAIDGDTLKVTCNERLPAGRHFKAYDMSGAWTRLKK
jgi:hypothetical protein